LIDLRLGDCLEVMPEIPNESIDAIICDPPYGTTACKWDSVIPFDLMWEQLNRVIKPNGAIVLFGSEPFSSALRMSNIENYKYDWIWEKSQGVNFAQCNHMPMSVYETISVFGNFGMSKNAKIQPKYNPQGVIEVNKKKNAKTNSEHRPCDKNRDHIQKYSNYPRQVLKFKSERGLHPTQKPLALMEYMVKTYTNEGDTVLDFTIGSGTTIKACKNLNRNGIGIEKEEKYFNIAKQRINECVGQQQTIF
jgi:site-specific DNA-methyltransferase (adenine-specific)